MCTNQMTWAASKSPRDISPSPDARAPPVFKRKCISLATQRMYRDENERVPVLPFDINMERSDVLNELGA